LPVLERRIEVPDEAKVCKKCGNPRFSALGEGVVTHQYEYVPARLIRHRIVREKCACQCGETVLTAPPPEQVLEGCEYGPGLHAHVVVAKCADSLPFYRQAKQFERAGVPMNRSTLCNLFHRSASLLDPLYQRMLELVSKENHVGADETPLPVQEEGGCRRSYIWTFHSKNIITYVHSATRSGETPARILGGTEGSLQVDGYTGYNKVTAPEGRERVSCWAHIRRYFFKALATAPETAAEMMDLIGELYEIEHRIRENDLVGTKAHRLLRDSESRAVVERIRTWLDENKDRHPPKSPIGKAIGYTEGQWKYLLRFLDDSALAIDNNKSERELRIFALGRKNFLFANNDDCAQNLAVLQSLVATCSANDVNPQDYLADVLIRTQSHPAKDLDELLPMNWKPPDTGQTG